MSVAVRAFGRDYNISQSNVARILTLRTMMEDILVNGVIDLSTIEIFRNPRYQAPFEYILDFLGGTIRGHPQGELLINLIHLTIFFDIPDLLNYILRLIESGRISIQDINLIGTYYQNVNPLINAATFYLTKNIDRFGQLPSWLQVLLLQDRAKTLPIEPKEKLLVLLGEPQYKIRIPIAHIPLISVGPGIRPLSPSEIPYFIQEGYPIYKYTELGTNEVRYLTCVDRIDSYIGLYPRFGGKPRCFRNRQDLTDTGLEEIISSGIQIKLYDSVDGYLVVTDANYNKNYIQTNRYTVIPEANMIIIV